MSPSSVSSTVKDSSTRLSSGQPHLPATSGEVGAGQLGKLLLQVLQRFMAILSVTLKCSLLHGRTNKHAI